MPPKGPKSEFLALKRFSLELEKRYLLPHTKSVGLAPPSRTEELDVAAFAVLFHGALENFVEGLSLWILARVQKSWLSKRASRATISLLLGTSYPIDHSTDTSTVFDVIRNAIDEAKKAHSTLIEKNNGVTVKHLRTLLIPLGVDVPSDPLLVGSLDTLIKMRHTWAHQYRFGAKTIKAAKDAQQTASECLQMAERLYKNTVSVKP